MPKFDFNNSRYARFFSDKTNQRFLQSFVNTEGLLYTNYGWYKTQFLILSLPVSLKQLWNVKQKNNSLSCLETMPIW